MERRPLTLDRGIPLFENRWLDWGSRIHPSVPLLFWGPISLGAIVVATFGDLSWFGVLSWSAAGYLTWILAEYSVHRWFFHFRPRSLILRRLFYLVHEHHHRYLERDRLLAPPLMSLSIGAVFIGLFFVILGPLVGLDAVWAFGGGFGAAYLAYDYTHYFIHFSRPRTRWGRFLRRCHLEHHFRTPDRWYCISWPWFDYLFRTERSGRVKAVVSSYADAHVWDDESLPEMVRRYELQSLEAATPSTVVRTTD